MTPPVCVDCENKNHEPGQPLYSTYGPKEAGMVGKVRCRVCANSVLEATGRPLIPPQRRTA